MRTQPTQPLKERVLRVLSRAIAHSFHAQDLAVTDSILGYTMLDPMSIPSYGSSMYGGGSGEWTPTSHRSTSLRSAYARFVRRIGAAARVALWGVLLSVLLLAFAVLRPR